MTLGRKKQQKISTEELAKTQVLNLEDVQKLAKYEKRVSKKPAAIVAIVGILSIIVGFTSQTVVSLSTMNQGTIDAPQVSSRISSENTTTGDTLTCSYTNVDATAEINIKTTYAFNFTDGLMKTYTKTTDVTPTSTNSVTALTSIQNGEVYFKELAKNSTTGYEVAVNEKETGYQISVKVNTNTLNTAALNTANLSDFYVKPDANKDVSKDEIKAWLVPAGYTCE